MQFPIKEFTNSPESTETVGHALASALARDKSLPRFVAMYGDLGVGKTAFVRGFCSELCRGATVKSPTFALVNEYRCPVPMGGIKRVYHFDMYRITDEDDLYSIGFYDYLDRRGICLVEWSENIPYALPDRYVRVEIIKNNADQPDSRLITAEIIGD